jgi:RimJ/RimL family protein N-acetyltransferase
MTPGTLTTEPMTRLQTDRLILREIDAERDFDGWAATMADPVTVRYIGGQVQDRAQAWRGMAAVIGHWKIRGYGFFSVESRATGEWLGRVGPWFPEGWPAPEIGWTLRREHWGHGYATEAARACLEYARDTLEWTRVIHVILTGNAGSVAVAQRLGSRFLDRQQGLPGVTTEEVMIYGQELR